MRLSLVAATNQHQLPPPPPPLTRTSNLEKQSQPVSFKLEDDASTSTSQTGEGSTFRPPPPPKRAVEQSRKQEHDGVHNFALESLSDFSEDQYAPPPPQRTKGQSTIPPPLAQRHGPNGDDRPITKPSVSINKDDFIPPPPRSNQDVRPSNGQNQQLRSPPINQVPINIVHPPRRETAGTFESQRIPPPPRYAAAKSYPIARDPVEVSDTSNQEKMQHILSPIRDVACDKEEHSTPPAGKIPSQEAVDPIGSEPGGEPMKLEEVELVEKESTNASVSKDSEGRNVEAPSVETEKSGLHAKSLSTFAVEEVVQRVGQKDGDSLERDRTTAGMIAVETTRLDDTPDSDEAKQQADLADRKTSDDNNGRFVSNGAFISPGLKETEKIATDGLGQIRVDAVDKASFNRVQPTAPPSSAAPPLSEMKILPQQNMQQGEQRHQSLPSRTEFVYQDRRAPAAMRTQAPPQGNSYRPLVSPPASAQQWKPQQPRQDVPPRQAQGYPTNQQHQTWQGPRVPPPNPMLSRPPLAQPPYRPQQPPRQTGGTAVTPTWKRLWRRVEKGLDELANFEDLVSDRAQHLASAVGFSRDTGKAMEPSGQVAGDVDFRRVAPARVNLAARKPDRPETPQARERESTTSGKPLSQLGDAKFAQTAATAAGRSETRRSIDWNDLTAGRKMIRANGGASHPSDKMRSEEQQQPSVESPTVSSNPFTSKPYEPQKASNEKKEEHRRGDRIPWQEPKPSDQQLQRRRPQRPPSPQSSIFDDDDDDEGSGSLLSRFTSGMSFLPRMPSVPRLLGFRRQDSFELASSLDAWGAEDDEHESRRGIMGIFRRKKSSRNVHQQKDRKSDANVGMTDTLAAFSDRCEHGKTNSLLTIAEEKKCRSLGRSRATLDVVCVLVALLGARQISGLERVVVPHSIFELVASTIPRLGSALSDSFDGWAPMILASAYLTSVTNSLVFKAKTRALAYSVAESVKREVQYAQMYMRLIASVPVDPALPESAYRAASLHVLGSVQSSRLGYFVAFILATLVASTVSILRPLLVEVVGGLVQIINLEQWRTWPLPFSELGIHLKDVLTSHFVTMSRLISSEVQFGLGHPLRVTFFASLAAALVAVTFLPGIEQKRKIQPVEKKDDDDEDDLLVDTTLALENMGISSATRLPMLSPAGAAEAALERWRLAQSSPSLPTNGGISIQSLLRLNVYTLLSGTILLAPVIVYNLFGIGLAGKTNSAAIGWDSLLDVSLVLWFTFRLAGKALAGAVDVMDARSSILGFLTSFSETLKEASRLHQSSASDLQLQSSISPTKGLLVEDLWVAHVAKRAWAVRGASLSCRNGQVVVILGDDSAGKSRLLTSIAEQIVSPPRRALSSNRVRGRISLGGLDITKWDRSQLQKRVGLVLNDVLTVANTASLLSGLTLEEILDPIDGMKSMDPSHNPNSKEKSSMILALKISGLYSSLLARLPSKLSTVVTAKEEDLIPSPLRPRCNALSPTEWSKLLVAKTLAQAVFDNENSAGSSTRVESCLVGSLLLLDDATVSLSEVEEANLIRTLRQTGAATLLTSNKWATGRFADRIAVLKDGAIVESGTHAELVARGPQHSLYAAKWHALTTQ